MPDTSEERCWCRIIHRDRVAAAADHALPPKAVAGIAGLFKALADPGRLRILWALSQGEMCVCDLAALLGVSESAVSHQLRLLRDLRLVANRRQGPVLYYRLLSEETVGLVRGALEQLHLECPAPAAARESA